MNVLILSCGTRSLLVDYFKQRKNGFDKVVVTDCSPYSPALYRADKYYIVPRMVEEDYLPTVFRICESEEINVVIPLQEDELVLISRNRREFLDRGIMPVVSEIEYVDLCRDKYKFYQKMLNLSVSVIPTYLHTELDKVLNKHDMPLFMKPRYGAGSVANYIIKNKNEVDVFAKNEGGEFVVQPFIDGTEYGVNAYVDFISGELSELFILKKIRMKSGETEKSVSVYNDDIKHIVMTICDKVPFVGPIDIDIIEKNGNYYVLEINPRFGGAYPHAYECGVNFVEQISNNAIGVRNKKLDMHYESGVIAFRYMTITTIKEEDLTYEK